MGTMDAEVLIASSLSFPVLVSGGFTAAIFRLSAFDAESDLVVTFVTSLHLKRVVELEAETRVDSK